MEDHSYKTVKPFGQDDAERALSEINPSEHYTETIRQYNGTGDPVVVTTEHPVGSLMRYHDHTFFEINYVVRGTCVNMIEGQRLDMRAGEFVLLHPETLHTLYVGKGCYAYNFLIDIAWINRFFERLIEASDKTEGDALLFARSASKPDAYKFIFFPRQGRCASFAHSMRYSFDLPCRSLFREAMMTQFLLYAFTSCPQARLSSSRGISSGAFKKIYRFTAQNYATVTQEMLMDSFHYSRSYICKLFKDHTGKSFTHNLIEIRLQRAQALLLSTCMPVEEVAFAVGYASVEYFHRLFRLYFGMTPGAYRASKR